MEITKGKLKKIIQEEVQRMTVADSATKGHAMAERLIVEFKELSINDRQVFLSNFVQFLNKENSWLLVKNTLIY